VLENIQSGTLESENLGLVGQEFDSCLKM
jgi:hypothetical protein